MANISKIQVNNVDYNIKDSVARGAISSFEEEISTTALNVSSLRFPKASPHDVFIQNNKTTGNIEITSAGHTITLPLTNSGEIALKENTFRKVYYNSASTPPQIEFYSDDTTFNAGVPASGSTPICTLDASAFIKDAMVSSVAISNGNLVITWNADSGISTPTSIPLTNIFNPANYYDKTAIDGMISDIEAGQVSIVDNLTTNDSAKALSAKQGKVLQDNKAEKSATVSGVSYTSSKIQKTINGSTTDVVSASTIVTDGGGYKKPSGGIPSSDMASAVQASLGKADSSVQTVSINGGSAIQPTDGNVDITIPSSDWSDVKPTGGVPATDLASAVQTSLGKADSAIQGVKVNGTELTPDSNKVVDVTVPTALADLSADSTHRLVTDTEKAAWNAKQDALTFDNVPTQSSTNPVKSGGVYSALADIYEGYDSSTETISFTFPVVN